MVNGKKIIISWDQTDNIKLYWAASAGFWTTEIKKIPSNCNRFQCKLFDHWNFFQSLQLITVSSWTVVTISILCGCAISISHLIYYGINNYNKVLTTGINFKYIFTIVMFCSLYNMFVYYALWKMIELVKKPCDRCPQSTVTRWEHCALPLPWRVWQAILTVHSALTERKAWCVQAVDVLIQLMCWNNCAFFKNNSWLLCLVQNYYWWWLLLKTIQ